MPLRGPSPTINFLFNLAHLVRQSSEWLTHQHGVTLEPHAIIVAIMAGVALMVVLFKHTRDLTSKKEGGPTENLLLVLYQRLMLGWCMLYLHLFHADDAFGMLWAAGVVGLIALAILLPRAHPGGVLPSDHWLSACGRFWRRWVYLLPADGMETLWLALGYLGSRVAFPATTGCVGQADRPGGELCAYDEPAVRACLDHSALCLVVAGLIWPCVEFGRVVVIRCADLYAPAPAAEAVPTPAPAAVPLQTLAKNKTVAEPVVTATAVEHDDEDDEHAAGQIDPAGASFFARTLALSNIAVASMVVTWVSSVASLAYAFEYSVARTDSACPSPLMSQYNSDLTILRQACARQWSTLQNTEMLSYATAGALAALFSVVPTSCPPALRLQFFVILCMSLWTGTNLGSCAVISTHCLV